MSNVTCLGGTKMYLAELLMAYTRLGKQVPVKLIDEVQYADDTILSTGLLRDVDTKILALLEEAKREILASTSRADKEVVKCQLDELERRLANGETTNSLQDEKVQEAKDFVNGVYKEGNSVSYRYISESMYSVIANLDTSNLVRTGSLKVDSLNYFTYSPFFIRRK